MKILFVAMSGSIHTVRWINQLKSQNWELYLFPSYDNRGVHKDLSGVKLCIPHRGFFLWLEKIGLSHVSKFVYTKYVHFKINNFPGYYHKLLSNYIAKIKPDVIHSLETQGGGYLVSETKTKYFENKNFPIWWHTNWGSDIFLFGRLSDHVERITKVLHNCDYYSCECARDKILAENLGFRGETLPIYPNTGGFDENFVKDVWSKSDITSKRKIIMLKGYQGWAGRALVGIRALERCGRILENYTLVIYSNYDGIDVSISSRLLSQNTGIKVLILPEDTPHSSILDFHSKARISIGLSISEGVSTSTLEAMAMGSFPIQSCTACVEEWYKDGISGFIVPPEDPEIIEKAIRSALTDDRLVDTASEINRKKIIENANMEKLSEISINSYLKIKK